MLFLESQVMLSPSRDVSVCPGSQLSFRCSTNLSFLEWNVTTFQLGKPDSRRQLVTAATELELDLLISRHLFNITRTSAYNSYPLTSTLTVAMVVTNLNATRIKCAEIGNSPTETSASVATINIINSRLMIIGH